MAESRPPSADRGVVLRAQGGVYWVQTAAGVAEATLRGKLKREESRPAERRVRGRRGARQRGDDRSAEERAELRVVVGDHVTLEREQAGDAQRWTIRALQPRRSALVRRAPGKAPRPKPIVANLDQVVVVFAVARPEPHLRMLDRFLVLCEANALEAVIVANKTDLVGEEEARARFATYERIGYRVLLTAAREGRGVEELRELLHGRISALAGPSGVGKSSLLNAVQPGLGLRVASISEAVQKGRHTTVTAELIPLEGGGFVADTPGLREVGLWGVEPAELDTYYREFRPYLGACRYGNSCTHVHEPGCAVRAAVEAGAVSPERYDSYRRLHAGEREDE